MIFYFSYDEYNDFFYFDELFSIGKDIFKLMVTGLMGIGGYSQGRGTGDEGQGAAKDDELCHPDVARELKNQRRRIK
jgi:hypothetical protein